MTESLFIAGEWGSVVMRLYLCRDGGGPVEVLATTTGSGVVGCGDFEAAFFAAAGAWFEAHGPLPVILAGMIGSNIGWRDSGYVAAPAGMAALAARLVTIHARGIDIHFTPGLECRNLFGLPDLVRGEEMQVLGWLDRRDEDGPGVICLPGRHVKWMLTDGDRIRSFTTGMHGELQDLLLTHGLLGKGVDRNAWSEAAFDAGLDIVHADPTLSLGHAVFATRGRLVLGDHTADQAAAFLSGLVIGCDIRDGLRALDARGLGGLTTWVLGHDAMTERYVRALGRYGAPWQTTDTPFLAAAGLGGLLRAAGVTVAPGEVVMRGDLSVAADK